MKKQLLFFLLIVTSIISIYIYFHFFSSLQNKYLTKEQKVMVQNIPYSVQLSNLNIEKHQLFCKYKSANKKEKIALINKAKTLYIEQISNHIFPYWYGTKWDFNGTTQKPQQGKIACGYFVTTILEDIDFPLNRVSLACMASEEMIKNLTQTKYIYHISNTNISAFESKIIEIGKGIYIVGLDKHTGFILYDEKGIFFIHSGGKFPCHVRKEKINASSTLNKSKYKVVGKISDDEQFILKWLSY
ncbi:MAG TPA: hypothetical protein PK431_00050 [Chitinophagales bacterium]|nr:hypothetical protein [Chitinophagales bacterium]